MPAPRKEPEWVQPFLAALASCGNVTRAAKLAGVDVTGVYNRRLRYPEFKAACVRVLEERALRAAPSTGSVAPQDERESSDVIAATGIRRVADSRWGKGAEERFLAELTVSANVARAAEAAGFSAATVYKRKIKYAHFSAGWDAAIAVGRARLEAHLLVAAERSFDPETLPVADGAPNVTVGEAISILKHGPAGAGGAGGGGSRRGGPRTDGYMDWVTDDDVAAMAEAEEAKERIFARLDRLREREDAKKTEQGWTRHGEHWIPPGWGPCP